MLFAMDQISTSAGAGVAASYSAGVFGEATSEIRGNACVDRAILAAHEVYKIWHIPSIACFHAPEKNAWGFLPCEILLAYLIERQIGVHC